MKKDLSPFEKSLLVGIAFFFALGVLTIVIVKIKLLLN